MVCSLADTTMGAALSLLLLLTLLHAAPCAIATKAKDPVPRPLLPSSSSAAVRLIIDTDMSTDCDDVGALCMAHALMSRGEVRALAGSLVVVHLNHPAFTRRHHRPGPMADVSLVLLLLEWYAQFWVRCR